MIDLFGNDTQPGKDHKASNKTGQSMYSNLIQLYGKKEGERCKTCKHLCRFQQSNAWSKCAIADPGLNTGPSGDWRVNWDACGKWQALYEYKEGDRVKRAVDNTFDNVGTVEVVYSWGCFIRWDNVASTGQKHSTIRFNRLELI